MIKNYTTLNSDNFSIYPHIYFVFKTARKLINLHKRFMVLRKCCCLYAGCSVNSNKAGTITQVNMPILAWSQPCKEIALLKGLRRVSRSESFIFSTKMSKKGRFSSKDFNFKNPNTIYLIVRTALHLTTAKVWRVSGLFS
jgi:hypothetical protein